MFIFISLLVLFFFRTYFVLLFVYVCKCATVEVRGQLSKVGFLFHLGVQSPACVASSNSLSELSSLRSLIFF